MTRRLSLQVEVAIRPYDDGSGFIAICPALLGAMVDADTEEEAMDAIREKVRAQIALELADGNEIPWQKPAETCFCKRRRLRVHVEVGPA